MTREERYTQGAEPARRIVAHTSLAPACPVSSTTATIIYMTPDLRRPCHEGRAPTRGEGGLAQLVEHLLCKQGVNGSSPLSSTGRNEVIDMLGTRRVKSETPRPRGGRRIAKSKREIELKEKSSDNDQGREGAAAPRPPSGGHADSVPFEETKEREKGRMGDACGSRRRRRT